MSLFTVGQAPWLLNGSRFPRVTDKLASDRYILGLGMNHTPFHLVCDFVQAFAVIDDIFNRDQGPVSIRYKGRGMQPFEANLDREMAKARCFNHFDDEKAVPLGIYEATEQYDHFRQWNGEVQLHADGTLDAHWNPNSRLLKMRDALRHPDAKHVVKVSWDYRPLRFAVEYLCRFGLVGPVVELTRFEIPVGRYSENIVVWEVRDF